MSVTRGNGPRQAFPLPWRYHTPVTTEHIMSKTLTVKAIESLKPGASRREVPDGEVSGLYLQIFPSGKASWAFRYRFWQAADAFEPAYAGFVKLLVLTGQRRNEVAGMFWREVDLDARLWTLPAARAKNSVEHSIPLSDQTVEILKVLPRIAGSDFVFTINGRNPIRGADAIKRRLDALTAPNTPPWVLHDIRRTVASGMARLGINLPVIEKLLNHVSGTFAGIVGVYQRHSFADEKRAAMQTWARHVEQLVSASPAANVVEWRRGA
jgi:integrase